MFVRAVQIAGIFGLIAIAIALAVAMFFYMRNSRAWEIAAGAPPEAVES